MKIEKLPSGHYRAQVYLGRDADGKRIRKSVTGTDRRAVELEAAQLRNAHRDMSASGTFAACADAYLTARGASLSPSTRQTYESCLKRLKRDHGQFCAKEIHSITTRDVQTVVDALAKGGLSPKTVSNYRGVISTVLTYNSIRPPVVRMPQRQRPDIHVPDEVTVRRTLKAAAGTDMELPIMLAAFGPLRRGEICALRPEDVQDNVIHVRRSLVKVGQEWIEKPPKTASSDRYIEMPRSVMVRIRRCKPDESGHLIHLNPTQISKHFARLLKAAGIAPYRFHDLRHFCASDLHAKGVPDIYIQQRTGHASQDVLRRVYTHTLQDQSAEQTARILAHFEDLMVQ